MSEIGCESYLLGSLQIGLAETQYVVKQQGHVVHIPLGWFGRNDNNGATKAKHSGTLQLAGTSYNAGFDLLWADTTDVLALPGSFYLISKQAM